MNRPLIFIVLAVLLVLYLAPTATASLPINVQEILYTIPRTYYAGAGLLIGAVLGAVFKDPHEPGEPKPEKKLRLKRNIPDTQLQEMKQHFNPDEAEAEEEDEPATETQPVAFDVDKELKFLLLEILKERVNGSPKASEKETQEVPPYADH